MAKLHFKYGTMNSGKSIDLMRTAYNYEEQGFKVLVIKPKIDTKAGDFLESRVGMKRKVDIVLDSSDNIIDILSGKLDNVKSIFVDEAQFLSSKQVDELYLISKVSDIPIICYGLRTNFMMESFVGSLRLLEIADVLEEIQTLCHCGSIARYVGRKYDDEYQLDGPVVVIDGTTYYDHVPLCGKCYLKEVKKINLKFYEEKLR